MNDKQVPYGGGCLIAILIGIMLWLIVVGTLHVMR